LIGHHFHGANHIDLNIIDGVYFSGIQVFYDEWMAKSGADKIKFKIQKTAKREELYGLELEEYRAVHAEWASEGRPPD
jgi:hypothetical protein